MKGNNMKKIILGMLGVAALTSPLNANEEEKTQVKEEQNWSKKYNEAIEKQTKERSKAFNEDKIQGDSQALAALIARQREVIMAIDRERESRTR